ncbi:HepT-like ribonuclease domain-containing protein [Persicitalea jodogahamensis]|uniref:DUF86 domain-containing protein n=1 Tax=Persicitalea jodogahamensis TaxID=402147 RepID=A0A8J3D7J1_9BACT|nr:HepT-like ribonuclease domain-containing protein [Persicitalea jodogahamensis]GHB72240.1 hypothetical protein GCM10007390_27870 [Persicitalea jodogahamensis]
MSRDKSQDLLPLLVILESLGKIELYAEGFSDADTFFNDGDQVRFNASLLLLLNVGEYAGRLSDELKNQSPDLPFQAIRGLRNRIAHNYTGIDYEMVFDIVKNDVPSIKSELIQKLSEEIAKGTYDLGELSAARHSTFYKHVDFESLL